MIDIFKGQLVERSRKLKCKWKFESVKELRSAYGIKSKWQRIVSWVYFKLGLADPYCTDMCGVNTEQELVNILKKEIDNE